METKANEKPITRQFTIEDIFIKPSKQPITKQERFVDLETEKRRRASK